MAKKKGTPGGKDKGRGSYARRSGLGRMRRAHAKAPTRLGNLERHSEDDSFLDRLATGRRMSDSGESLLAKFNRLARDGEAQSGREASVSGFDGQDVMVREGDGSERAGSIRGVLKKMLVGAKHPLSVGDRVLVENDEGGRIVIVGVRPRRNQLARADSHNKALEHVFAANIDRLVIVAAIARPDLKTGLIDRYLVIAHHNDIEPMIVLNKADLGDAEEVAALYRHLGYTVVTTQANDPEDDGILELRRVLDGLSCVFCGQSGVGKSSLVAAIHPGLDLRIGAVSDTLHKGRHTTNASRSYPVPGGGLVIDTPGIRECGITGLEGLDLALLYRDIATLQPQCHFVDCSHRHEPDCAVLAALQSGALAGSRYDSYRSILEEDLGT